MQVGQLLFQQYMKIIGARDIAGAARAGADFVQGIVHGGEYILVLANAQIVIRTPNGDILGAAVMMAGCLGEIARVAFQFGKNTVAPLAEQFSQPISKYLVVVPY